MNLYRQLKIPVLLFRTGLIAALIVISILAFIPLDTDINIVSSDKANHFVAFIVLSALLDGSWQQTKFDISKSICVCLYALFIELVQSQLPYRDFSWLDMVADVSGMTSYILFILLAEKILKFYNKQP